MIFLPKVYLQLHLPLQHGGSQGFVGGLHAGRQQAGFGGGLMRIVRQFSGCSQFFLLQDDRQAFGCSRDFDSQLAGVTFLQQQFTILQFLFGVGFLQQHFLSEHVGLGWGLGAQEQHDGEALQHPRERERDLNMMMMSIHLNFGILSAALMFCKRN